MQWNGDPFWNHVPSNEWNFYTVYNKVTLQSDSTYVYIRIYTIYTIYALFTIGWRKCTTNVRVLPVHPLHSSKCVRFSIWTELCLCTLQQGFSTFFVAASQENVKFKSCLSTYKTWLRKIIYENKFCLPNRIRIWTQYFLNGAVVENLCATACWIQLAWCQCASLRQSLTMHGLHSALQQIRERVKWRQKECILYLFRACPLCTAHIGL